jgi:hypothetical protein
MPNDRHTNRKAHNFIDLTGQKIEKLTVLYDTGKRKNKKTPIWKCKCDCGNEVEILSKYLHSRETKSCGCIAKGNAHNRTGFEYINGSFFYHIKQNAKSKGIPFEISAKDIFDLFESQQGLCALSGIKLIIVDNYRDDSIKQTASIDRIDSSKGYVLGNIQWVHKVINIMKNRYSTNEFILLCRAVSNHTQSYELDNIDIPSIGFNKSPRLGI